MFEVRSAYEQKRNPVLHCPTPFAYTINDQLHLVGGIRKRRIILFLGLLHVQLRLTELVRLRRLHLHLGDLVMVDERRTLLNANSQITPATYEHYHQKHA